MAELTLDFSHLLLHQQDGLHLHEQGGRRLVSAEVRITCAPDAPGAGEPRRATLHLSFSPVDLDEPLPREFLEALEPLADILASEGPRAEHRITVHVGPEASPETKRAADFLHDLLEALADESSPLRKRLLRARAKRMLTAAKRRTDAAAAPPVLESFSPPITKSLDLPHAPPPATRGLIDDVPSPEAPLCLNAWFPEHPADPIRLPVGLPAVLRVNLGPPRDAAAASEALPPDVLQALQEVPFIDVLVLCAGADIQPLRRRLQMPPDPAVILEFILTPRRPGPLEIQIVLLVHNEPVHRMLVPVDATAPMAASAPGPASP